MTYLDAILDRRRAQSFWDPELWDFTERVGGVPSHLLNDRDVQPRPLEYLPDAALQARLAHIERNVQYLDGGSVDRDAMRPEEGWLSPWWWLRLRHWTLSEFARRDLAPQPTMPVPQMPPLNPEFVGIHGGGSPRIFRISRLPYLLETLTLGRLRFTPAKRYQAMEGDAARGDDEMKKGYRRSARRLTITTADGRAIAALGDVTFDTARLTPEGAELPYWMFCASSDLDPRLIADFSEGKGDDAVLAVFDTEAFRQRARPAIAGAAPQATMLVAPIDYYDVYHPPRGGVSPVTMKDMRFAGQRELRFVLDPGRRASLGDEPISINIGSIEDIAALYSADGRRIAGTGPVSFFS